MLSNSINLLLDATLATLYMVLISGLISIVGGLPLGIILAITQPNGLLHNKLYHIGLGFVVDIIRAIPFIILLVALIPLTRLIVGTSIGTNAAIVPLSIGAIPFVARIVQNALLEINFGLIEAGQALGATSWQIITKVLLPEALPAIINGITVTLITLVGYSAMAGAVSGGGLGSVAINYGYQQFNTNIMIATSVILIIIVYLIQFLGDRLAKKIRH